jgi:hypothetical protein
VVLDPATGGPATCEVHAGPVAVTCAAHAKYRFGNSGLHRTGIKHASRMLVMGVCNPAGEAADYNGLYFTDAELRELARGQLQNVPVKAEHRGQELGRVVSSFVDGEGRLNCMMRIAEETVEGAIAAANTLRRGPKDWVSFLSVFQNQCWIIASIIASAPKTYEVRKDLRIAVCNFFSSAERLGHSITESLMSQIKCGPSWVRT